MRKAKLQLRKRLLTPLRDMRTVEATMDDLLKHPMNDDYVFVRLLDETPVLIPDGKGSVRLSKCDACRTKCSVSINRQWSRWCEQVLRQKMDDLSLFRAFYQEVKGTAASEETEAIFTEVLTRAIT